MAVAAEGGERDRASRKRDLLAVYLDYLLFAAAFTPTVWVVKTAGGPSVSLLGTLAVFALIRIVLTRLLNGTPGRWALGVERDRNALVIDPEVREREAWWTILAGVLLVLEGSKNLVRWTEGLPPPPVLGAALPDGLSFAAISLVGTANVVAGMLVLRTHWAGALVGGSVLGLELLSCVVGREAFREWIVRAVSIRRDLQGRGLREGELEFMQAVVPMAVWLGFFVGVVVLMLAGLRFYARRTV